MISGWRLSVSLGDYVVLVLVWLTGARYTDSSVMAVVTVFAVSL